MTPVALIDLAKRKNAAHTVLILAMAGARTPGAFANKMTEKDRDIEMNKAVRGQREAYENLCDEYNVRLIELYATTHNPLLEITSNGEVKLA